MSIPVSGRARLRRNAVLAARWLHIYLSMASFALVLFFAVTGLTLNHPDWFAGRSRTTEHRGSVRGAYLGKGNNGAVDQDALTGLLREREHLHGAVTDFRVDEAQISASFRAPGYTADAFIDRDSGRYDVTVVQNGFVAVLNDLHKGRDAGRVWAWVIDGSAVLLTLVSFTGLVLLWFLYKRRTSGLLLAGATAGGVLLLWIFFVR